MLHLLLPVASAAPVVRGTGDLTCAVYLHTPPGQAPVPLVLSMGGTGLYSNGENGAVAYFEPLVERGVAAVVQFDKPGVRFDGALRVDDATYDRYTVDDLVACADGALAHAITTLGDRFDGRVVVAGHSEGAVVAIHLLDAHSERRPTAVVLSGAPLAAWDDILDAQLSRAERRALDRAIDRDDAAAARAIAPVGPAYHRQALAAEAPGAVLRRLGEAGLPVPLQLFHGLADRNASADEVRALERWSDQRAEGDLPTLDLCARYYEAGHGLNRAAVEDIVRVVESALESRPRDGLR